MWLLRQGLQRLPPANDFVKMQVQAAKMLHKTFRLPEKHLFLLTKPNKTGLIARLIFFKLI